MFSNFIKRKLPSQTTVLLNKYYNTCKQTNSTTDANPLNENQNRSFTNDRQIALNKQIDANDETKLDNLLVGVAVGLNIKSHLDLFKSKEDKDEEKERNSNEDDKRDKCIFINSLKYLTNLSQLSVLPKTSSFNNGDKLSSTLSISTSSNSPNDCVNILPNKTNNENEIKSKTVHLQIDLITLNLIQKSNEYENEMINLLGMTHLENNQPKKAIRLLRKAKSSSKCMFNLGLIYEMGKHNQNDVVPDYNKASKYYEHAARMGHGYAKYNLGLIYLYGKGQTKVNTEKGNELLRQAADLGIAEAQKYINELKFQTLFKSLNLFEKIKKMTSNSFHSSSSTPDLLRDI